MYCMDSSGRVFERTMACWPVEGEFLNLKLQALGFGQVMLDGLHDEDDEDDGDGDTSLL